MLIPILRRIVDPINLSPMSGVPQTSHKAWAAALTTLITAAAAWGMAYMTGTQDPSLVDMLREAGANFLMVTLTIGVPAAVSYAATYLIPNKPKG